MGCTDGRKGIGEREKAWIETVTKLHSSSYFIFTSTHSDKKRKSKETSFTWEYPDKAEKH